MSEILINDLDATDVSLSSLSTQKFSQVHGGFGAAPPVGEDGLPLFESPKLDFKPIKIDGRLIVIIPQ